MAVFTAENTAELVHITSGGIYRHFSRSYLLSVAVFTAALASCFILTRPVVLLFCFSVRIYVNCKAPLSFVKWRLRSAYTMMTVVMMMMIW